MPERVTSPDPEIPKGPVPVVVVRDDSINSYVMDKLKSMEGAYKKLIIAIVALSCFLVLTVGLVFYGQNKYERNRDTIGYTSCVSRYDLSIGFNQMRNNQMLVQEKFGMEALPEGYKVPNKRKVPNCTARYPKAAADALGEGAGSGG